MMSWKIAARKTPWRVSSEHSARYSVVPSMGRSSGSVASERLPGGWRRASINAAKSEGAAGEAAGWNDATSDMGEGKTHAKNPRTAIFWVMRKRLRPRRWRVPFPGLPRGAGGAIFGGMGVTDHHVHLYPDALNRDPAGWAALHGEPHWATLCTRRRRDGSSVQTFPSVDELLRSMDAAGVERAVLLGWYWERPENCVWQNRFYADCVRAHPDRFAAWAAVHAGAPAEAVREELRRARDDGLTGLGELSPHSQGAGFDAPGF